MSIDDPRDLENIDRDIRIIELKEEAKELTGGRMTFHEAPDCPPEIAERFLENVAEMERAGWITHHEQLKEDGITMPPADRLDDAQLHAKLWEIIRDLGERRVFISHTNDLSDRELYVHLREDVFHESAINMRFPPHQVPPYDRDRLLPECVLGPPPEDPEYYRDVFGPPEDDDDRNC